MQSLILQDRDLLYKQHIDILYITKYVKFSVATIWGDKKLFNKGCLVKDLLKETVSKSLVSKLQLS